MKQPIFTFRHGEPVTDVQKCCRGAGSDCELSERGIQQTEGNVCYLADRFGEQLRRAIVVTSGMKRTNVFGEMLAAKGAAYVHDEDFKAIHAGDWEGMAWEEIKRRWPEQFRNCTENGEHLIVPGGESVAALKDRVVRAWSTWIRERCSALIIVSHDSPNAIINQYVEGHTMLNLRGQTIGAMHEYEKDEAGVHIKQRNVVPYQAYAPTDVAQ